MIEKSMEPQELLAQLQNAARYDPTKAVRTDVPETVGVYVWFEKNTSRVVYIGVAAGRGGLRKRIWGQHLNGNYLERRESKFCDKDRFQLQRTVAGGKRAIDKSAFRKNVARKYRLSAGIKSVGFLKAHFDFTLIELPKLSALEIKTVEDQLIEIAQPTYNIRGRQRSDTEP